MTDLQLRPAHEDDFARILALNDSEVQHTSAMDRARLQRLHDWSSYHKVALIDGTIVAFLLAMREGTAYDSENYRFFEARGTGHLYVDRIVVAESERGRGLGPVLYEAVFAEARRRGLPEVTCEVNLDPPNPGSLAFHARLGFAQVGTQATKGGTVTVALLAAPVA